MLDLLKATLRACSKNGKVVVTAWVTNERQVLSEPVWFDIKTWDYDQGTIMLGKNTRKWYRLSDALYPIQPTWASIEGVPVRPLATQIYSFTVIGGRSQLGVIGGVSIQGSEGVLGDRVTFGYYSEERC